MKKCPTCGHHAMSYWIRCVDCGGALVPRPQ